MSAYGRKRTLGLSLNDPSLTSALEKKADIQALFRECGQGGETRKR